MSEFKNGQRVKVEFEATIGSTCGTTLYVRRDDGVINSIAAKLVTPVDPLNWPPQLGDIWEANGEEYYAEEWRQPHYDDVNLVLQPFSHRNDTYAYSDESSYAKRLSDFKALNPVLVRRRGQ